MKPDERKVPSYKCCEVEAKAVFDEWFKKNDKQLY
jgi:hypothetical protein